MTRRAPRPASNDDLQAQSIGEPGVRNAASLVIFKRDNDGTVCVLMGRRHPDTAFLPNKYVFPGGRFENSDRDVCTSGTLSRHAQRHLMVSVPEDTHPETMNALALTAIRETFEETGVVIGAPQCGNVAGATQANALPSGAPSSGPSSLWQTFFDTGNHPDPSGLQFIARAITPPGRPRRYDTRFFCISENHISARRAPLDDELADIGWLSLEEARSRDIASITHHLLDDLTRLTAPDEKQTGPAAVPFYFYQNDAFHRVLLSHQDGIA